MPAVCPEEKSGGNQVTNYHFHLQIGDWFVLYQLCKNCNPYFFREFIRELAIEIKHRPKKSKSSGTLALSQAAPQSPGAARASPLHSLARATDITRSQGALTKDTDNGIAV